MADKIELEYIIYREVNSSDVGSTNFYSRLVFLEIQLNEEKVKIMALDDKRKPILCPVEKADESGVICPCEIPEESPYFDADAIIDLIKEEKKKNRYFSLSEIGDILYNKFYYPSPVNINSFKELNQLERGARLMDSGADSVQYLKGSCLAVTYRSIDELERTVLYFNPDGKVYRIVNHKS